MLKTSLLKTKVCLATLNKYFSTSTPTYKDFFDDQIRSQVLFMLLVPFFHRSSKILGDGNVVFLLHYDDLTRFITRYVVLP